MPADRSSSRTRLARRRFLGALAAAPAALAGCSGAAAAPGATARAPGAPAPAGAAGRPPAPDAATRAVREQPLAADAEPAFVFRAGAARPGEP
ncbi:MAG TPA: hypothetical protein VFL83_13340 [Anaeromyxobacter sp.]|nr:hypothetical protein [Anaeromyxobacter sp.]